MLRCLRFVKENKEIQRAEVAYLRGLRTQVIVFHDDGMRTMQRKFLSAQVF